MIILLKRSNILAICYCYAESQLTNPATAYLVILSWSRTSKEPTMRPGRGQIPNISS
jgi:hypothetical protein